MSGRAHGAARRPRDRCRPASRRPRGRRARSAGRGRDRRRPAARGTSSGPFRPSPRRRPGSRAPPPRAASAGAPGRWSRQRSRRPHALRVLETGRVAEAADLEAADAPAVGAQTEANALHRKLVLAEELLEVRAERVGVTELAADDDAAVERLTCELDDVDLAVLADVRGGDMGGADLQPDDLALLARGALGGLGRARLGGGLRPAPERELDRPARLLLIRNLRGLLGCGGGAPRGEAGEAARLLLLGRVLARRRPSEAARLLLLGRVLTLRRPGEAARLLLLGRILTLRRPREAARLAVGRAQVLL